MKLKCRTLGQSVLLIVLLASAAHAKSQTGSLSGIVLDPSGTPQMGATVMLVANDGAGQTVSRLLTNQRGAFLADVKPGVYSIRVTLAGFLPALEQHVTVVADVTTLVRLQVETVFASLDKLRKNPTSQTDRDDWKWVLRSSAATRPILQWRDDGSQAAAVQTAEPDVSRNEQPRGLVELTTGSPDSNSPSLPDQSTLPATTFSYDQKLGGDGHILMAGQMNTSTSSGGFSTIWLPSGELGQGSETILVARHDQTGMPGFRYQGVRLDQSEVMQVGQKIVVRVGGEYVRVGTRFTASALRPHTEIEARLAKTWTAMFIVAESPSEMQSQQTGTLEAAVANLDTLPTMLFDMRRPVLENDDHQEASLSHRVGKHAYIEAAAFHDSVEHEGVLGVGTVAESESFATPLLPGIFRYDAGASKSWGTRLAYRRRLSDHIDVAAVYSWAGALSAGAPGEGASVSDLSDCLQESYHHSVAARITGKLQRSGTEFQASYKWVSGDALTHEDNYGDAAYLLAPDLHVSIRQPLPGFAFAGHWEALADFSNILGQGYVPISTTQDSKLMVMPLLRSFRGGVSFQF